MRLIATALACVLAAFGAAFLIGRVANDHQGSATAATVTTVRAATRARPPVTRAHPNRGLAAQFEAGLRGLRHRRRIHHRHVHHPPAALPPAPVVPSAPTTTRSVTPAPTPTPTPTPTPAPTHSTPTHHKSGGSGTTTIG